MADRVYLPSRYSTEQVLRVTAQLYRNQISTDKANIYPSVGAFAQTLRCGDRVVLHSLGVFESTVELLGALRLFFRAGASVWSIREPELTDRLSPSLVEELYRTGLCGLFDQPAEELACLDPELLSKIDRVEHLVRTRPISLTKACQITHCSRNVYYYYKRMAAQRAL